LTKRLAVVVAHPDDDTFGCAGSVALHAGDPDLRFTLVHVTSGEAGIISDPALATRETLGEIRELEDRRSWTALGREPDRHEFFRHADHAVSAISQPELATQIAEVLREEHPDVVVTFGPDGVTAHPDHIAVGAATTDAFHACRGETADGFERLLFFVVSESRFRLINELLVGAGLGPFDPTRLYDPRGVPDAEVGVDVDCSTVVGRKRAALDEHRTQAAETEAYPPELRVTLLDRETHVVAWPPRRPGDRVFRDVFEGLEGPAAPGGRVGSDE
jgi:LmbE family N-acetylglucosaminyl deacetylase